MREKRDVKGGGVGLTLFKGADFEFFNIALRPSRRFETN
jgi:hypothetical protein